jgi:ubiquinone/menaquinone biosynthesis C-methylase UbiE
VLVGTLCRELFTSKQFGRIPEPDLGMDSEEAVSAFVRAGKPDGILSGVYVFYLEQALNMIRPGDRVLDLGCGPATLLASIASLNRQSSFLGVDVSARMIAAGNESLRASATRNVELRVDDMTKLSSVESGSIDLVLSSMALHHLPDTDQLRRCFEAIERVMAPGSRMFISDFGRLNSLKSVDYFVRRAIPEDEPILEHDYRASLRAAFSPKEISTALSDRMRNRLSIYSTVMIPMMIVVMAPLPDSSREGCWNVHQVLRTLPYARRADYWQLRVGLRLGGMPVKNDGDTYSVLT